MVMLPALRVGRAGRAVDEDRCVVLVLVARAVAFWRATMACMARTVLLLPAVVAAERAVR